jgi:hypothetical protein
VKDPNEEDPVSKLFRQTNDDNGFSFVTTQPPTVPLDTGDEDPLYDGDRTMTAKSGGAAMKSKHKADIAPLAIHTITHNNFRTALLDSMVIGCKYGFSSICS